MNTGTILMADKESGRAALLRRELEEAGYQATCVSAKEGFLKRLHDEPPDLVVLDLEFGGLEALADISKEASHIPVVLISPCEAPCIDDFRMWLADAVVVRSADLTELKQVVGDLLERRPASREARRLDGSFLPLR